MMKGLGGNGFKNLYKVKSFFVGYWIYLYKED